MHEHRLIERMLGLLRKEASRIQNGELVDSLFVEQAVDFFRTFADRCHHGKEEDILFRELRSKPMSEPHRMTMNELIEEHVQGRRLVSWLEEANHSLAYGGEGSAAGDVHAAMDALLTFYPNHIEKEDKRFFHPIMDHFTREEMDAMLEEYDAFEKELLHEKYKGMIEGFERKKGQLA
jgi:hemerythrin-like domain-containing protein